jgi:hypothetical protein
MPDLLDFEWQRPVGGYELVTIRAKEVEWEPEWTEPVPTWLPIPGASEETMRMLKLGWHPKARRIAPKPNSIIPLSEYWERGDDRCLAPVSDKTERIKPLRESEALFMEFSELSSPPKIVEFASRNGLLLHLERWESLRDWQKEITTFRKAVKHWRDAQKTDDYDRLIPAIRLPDLSAALAPARAGGPPFLQLKPKTLLDCLWVRFAQAIAASSQLRRCAECPTWFVFGTGTGRRKSAHYCSDRCRKAAFLSRRHAE